MLKKSLEKTWNIREKDFIFALPNREEFGIIARLELWGSGLGIKEIFFQKSLRVTKEVVLLHPL